MNKCIMCGTSQYSVRIYGIKDNYYLCPKCLIEQTKDLNITQLTRKTSRQNKLLVTRQRKQHIQDRLDAKLNYYLLSWKIHVKHD